MKKILSYLILIVSVFAAAQTNKELKVEIDEIKTELANLKTEIQSVKSQNLYLKDALEIRKPILEQVKDSTSFKIIKVVGDKKTESITISILIEALDRNKNPLIDSFSAIDLEGDEFGVNRLNDITGLRYGRTAALTKKDPLKILPVIIKVPKSTQILKLFKFHYFSAESMNHEDIEFRDLNIIWK